MRRSELTLLLGLTLAAALACEDPSGPDDARVEVPDDSDLAAVQAWLYAGEYLEWERHDPPPPPGSSGMSGGARVYLSPELAASLRAGSSSHPPGSVAVREIVDAKM